MLIAISWYGCTEMFDKLYVVIMCKAPVAGRVKTRLMSHYSAEEACEIHRAMAETVINRASTIFSGCHIASDDVSHPFFQQFDLPLIAQGEGDLGVRMSRLMVQAFNDGAEAVLFLGTDSPHMPQSRLERAIGMLAEHDVVLGPVDDGGYDLIAMNRLQKALFESIDWGSERVFSQTLERAVAGGVSVGQLDVSYDLDTPESLEQAATLWCSPVLRPQTHQQGTASGS